MDKLVEVLLDKRLKKEEEFKNKLEKEKIESEIVIEIIKNEDKENIIDEQIKQDVEGELKKIEEDNKTI